MKSSAAVAVTFWDVFVGSRRLFGSALALGTLGSALALGASYKDGSSTDVWLIKEHSMKLQLLYRWTYQQFKLSRPCISQHRFCSNLKENNDLTPFTNMNHELLGALLGEPIDFAISDDLDLEPGESTCPGSAWTPFGLLAMLQGEKAP